MKFDILSLVRSKPTHKISRLEFLVLLSLRKGPMHGYAVMKKLTRKMPGVWTAKSGSLYPLLRRMQKKGLVTARVVGGRKEYKLTEVGAEAVDQYLAAWNELYHLFKEMSQEERQ
ncbi:MAG: PadR family transcriptional regulator [Candidatus Diapherotrites archaeon]|nr:PadR family transcriptional regulator [Candidatus Diapherotrites archaeon]